MSRTRKIAVVAIAVLALIFIPKNSSALYDDEGNVNLIRYYAGTDCDLEDSSTNIPDRYATRTPGLSTYQEQWIDRNYSYAQSLTVEFGIPWEAVLAQALVESYAGSNKNATLNNRLFTKDFTEKQFFANTDESFRSYFEYIQRRNQKYSSEGVFKYATATDPVKYIEALEKAGYSPNLGSSSKNASYFTDVKEIITAIQYRATEKGWESSSGLENKYIEMGRNAEKNLPDTDIATYSAVDYLTNATATACSCSSATFSSGIRWQEGWISGLSFSNYYRTPVIDTSYEKKIKSRAYGMSLKGDIKIVLKTTETSNHKDAKTTNPLDLYPDGNYPHFTIDLKHRQVFQHFSILQSSAAMDKKNRNGKIVISIVGYADKSHKDSSGYLFNEENYEYSDWGFLASLIKGVTEHYNISLQDNFSGEGDAKIWEHVIEEFPSNEYEATSKCATNEAINYSLTPLMIERISNRYNSDNVSPYSSRLPSNLKSNPSSFVAYFIQRYTSLKRVAQNAEQGRDWGESRDLVQKLSEDYPQLSVGTELRPYAVYSSTSDYMLCGDESCGRTGIVLRIENGVATTIEASYPDNKTSVKTFSITHFNNRKHGYSFAYLEPFMNYSEVEGE